MRSGSIAARPGAPLASAGTARALRPSSAATLFSLVVLLLAAAPARAGDDERRRAAALVDEGVGLFGRGDFAAALERFERARQLYPSPKIEFNIGEALRKLGRTAEAAAAYDRFLSGTADDSREVTAQRRTARTALDGLEGRLGRIGLRIEPDDPALGAEVRVDDLPAEIRPGRPLYVAPGRHAIEVSAPGYRAVRTEVAVAAGELRDVAVALGREAAAPRAPAETAGGASGPLISRPAPRQEPPAPRHRRVWTWVAAGAAGGLLAGGILFGRRADRAYDEYQETGSPERYDQLRSQIGRDSLTANLLFAGSGAAAIGSVLLFVGEF